MSVCPWKRFSTFHWVWPWRQQMTRRVMGFGSGLGGEQGAGAAPGRGPGPVPRPLRPGRCSVAVLRRAALAAPRALRQRDDGAVLPQPLQAVVPALLLVLDVHDDLGVVEEHPAAVALALAAHRLDPGAVPEAVLHLVDD